MRLFFVPGPQTAPHYRGHCNADGRARQGRNTADRVCHSVGRNGRRTQRGNQTADAELANLKHTVFQPGGHTQPQNPTNQILLWAK